MQNKDNFRYIINMNFHNNSVGGSRNIVEPIKTLKEAQEYRCLVDETVFDACVVDRVTRNVVEWWKRKGKLVDNIKTDKDD